MCTDETQRKMMKKLKVSVDNLDSPLQKLEDKLYPFVNYLVLPVFALANAGVNLGQGNGTISSMSPVFWGIAAGLVIGKPIGITLLSWLSVRFGIAQLPSGIMWMQIWAMSCLAGIGFTMSLFITNLAFSDPLLIHQAKLAIIIGSILSAFLGMAVFFLFNAIRRAK
jgi:NhaA family Na+:H+ antiporter